MNQSDYKKMNLKNGSQTALAVLGEKPKRKKIRNMIILIAVLVIAAIFVRLQFGPPILWADISEYENEEILVTGLLEDEFYITPKDLAALKIYSATAVGKSQKAGTVKATGPTLETFLSEYGKKPTDFKQVKFYASDDYTVTLVQTLYEKDTVMSLANGNDSLEEYQRPMRIVVPDEDSGKWIYAVTKIEFTPN